ncbi:hypothetical protein EB796_007673 [Bugula neritina]|uniref:Receptor-type tyrosine-protein phosphatase U-like Fn3 domain-containing protein n=1 Tax=Bugula neritina TaxID=10212 RepID=A0A7J7K5W4_BUGNE|nr:hypothetical protein EB796_007673 [Bugula neritina]
MIVFNVCCEKSYLILVQRKTKSKRAVSSSNCIPYSDSQSVSRSSLTLTQSCYITAEILANDTKLSTPGGYEFTVGDGKSYNGYTNAKLISLVKYDVWAAYMDTQDLTTVIGLSVGLPLTVIIAMAIAGIAFIKVRRKSAKKEKGIDTPAIDGKSGKLPYRIPPPTASVTGSQPIYANQTFEEEEIIYEVPDDKPGNSVMTIKDIQNLLYLLLLVERTAFASSVCKLCQAFSVFCMSIRRLCTILTMLSSATLTKLMK